MVMALLTHPRPTSVRRWSRTLLATLAATALFAFGCDTPVRIGGHVSDPESVDAIEAGQYSQEDVRALLGTPSTVSTFDEQKWYYIGQKSTQFAFQHPEILERSVLVVSFDSRGIVTDKQLFSLEDGREITPIARVTPTEGRDFTVMQQLLGNLGRLPGGSTGGGAPNIPGG